VPHLVAFFMSYSYNLSTINTNLDFECRINKLNYFLDY